MGLGHRRNNPGKSVPVKGQQLASVVLGLVQIREWFLPSTRLPSSGETFHPPNIVSSAPSASGRLPHSSHLGLIGFSLKQFNQKGNELINEGTQQVGDAS